jgi:clan AA aspartic protease
MITGKIVDNQEAIIELEIVDVNDTEKVEAIIDTGFTGELILPGDLIDRLGLPRIGELPITLGDGNEIDVGLYLGIVLWQGENRIVQVLRTSGKPLIGMSLLYGNRLTVDVIIDGDVTIETLP